MKNFKSNLNKNTNDCELNENSLNLTNQVGKGKRTFNVDVDLKKVDEDDRQIIEEDNDVNDIDLEDIEDEDDELAFSEGEDHELTAEQLAVIQKKIDKEEKLFKVLRPSEFEKNDDDDDDDVDGMEGVENKKFQNKRKSKRRNRINKKPRKLKSDLDLDGAFEMSSDDDN